MKCPHCGATTTAGAAFCAHCGGTLSPGGTAAHTASHRPVRRTLTAPSLALDPAIDPSLRPELKQLLEQWAAPASQAALAIHLMGQNYPLASVDALRELLEGGWILPDTPVFHRKQERWFEANQCPGLRTEEPFDPDDTRRLEVRDASHSTDSSPSNEGRLVLAARLGRQAEEAAAKQEYTRAIDIYEKVIQLDKSYPLAQKRLRELRRQREKRDAKTTELSLLSPAAEALGRQPLGRQPTSSSGVASGGRAASGAAVSGASGAAVSGASGAAVSGASGAVAPNAPVSPAPPSSWKGSAPPSGLPRSRSPARPSGEQTAVLTLDDAIEIEEIEDDDEKTSAGENHWLEVEERTAQESVLDGEAELELEEDTDTLSIHAKEVPEVEELILPHEEEMPTSQKDPPSQVVLSPLFSTQAEVTLPEALAGRDLRLESVPTLRESEPLSLRESEPLRKLEPPQEWKLLQEWKPPREPKSSRESEFPLEEEATTSYELSQEDHSSQGVPVQVSLFQSPTALVRRTDSTPPPVRAFGQEEPALAGPPTTPTASAPWRVVMGCEALKERELAALLEEPASSSEALWRAFSQSAAVASVSQGGKLVAVGRVVSDGVRTALLCDLAVAPSQRHNASLFRQLTHALVQAVRGVPMLVQVPPSLLPLAEEVGWQASDAPVFVLPLAKTSSRV